MATFIIILVTLLVSAAGIYIVVACVGLNNKQMPKLPRDRWRLIKGLARGGRPTTGALQALQRAQAELAAHAASRAVTAPGGSR